MAEVRGNQVQIPADAIRARPDRGVAAFEQGMAASREWARKATQRTLDWIEEHPGGALLIALGAGFLVGQLFFRRSPAVEDEEE
jgi:ElaB/YqjD/DUF883 family membrane-anchored ribosome-binding protein